MPGRTRRSGLGRSWRRWLVPEQRDGASAPLWLRLLFVVGVVALPLLVLSLGIAWSQYRAERAQAEQQLQQQARAMAQLVDQQFRVAEAVLATLASSDALARNDIQTFDAEMLAAQRLLAREYQPATQPVTIRLLNADGTLRFDTRQNPKVPQGSIPAVQAALKTGQPQISGLFLGRMDGEPYIVVAHPLFATGKPASPDTVTGAIALNVPRGRLRAIVNNAGLPSGALASVLDGNAVTVARSLHDAETVGKPPPPPVQHALLAAESGVLTGGLPTLEGVTSTIAFARAPQSGYIVKLNIPEQVFLAPLQATFLRTAGLGLALLAAGSAIALLLGRRMTAALRRVPAIAAEKSRGADPEPTGLREADELATVLSRILAERARAEERLGESEERLRLAVEAAEVGLWDVDPVNDQLYWPPRVKAMFGISPGVPVSMADFYAGLHPEDRGFVTDAFARAIDPQQRALYDVEYRTVGRQDGLIRWVAAKGRGLFDANQRCVRVIGTAIDISGRKAAEQQLRELNETLEQRVTLAISERDRVWRNSRDLLVVIGADGMFRAVNPAWTAILGHQPADVAGHSFRAFVWPDDLQRTQDALDRAAHRRDLTSFENRYRHIDGTPRWISWHTSVEGDVVYAYGRDVTAEKEAAAELAEAQETLLQAQKIETMGQLTGGVAHDFNNLLTPIVGALDLLYRKLEGDRGAQRLIGAALQAADRARILIQRLLAFSRRQHLEARPVDIAALIESLADLATRSLGPQIHLDLRIADNLPAARVDPNQLELALLNLAVNARDAMAGTGTLVIAAAEGTGVRAGKLPPGRYVRIDVTDTGCGMDEDTVRRAVEPFFTTKGVGRGTGLGLSMVHGLAAQSGGAFALRSKPGEGTTATLWLPASDEPALRPRPDVPGAVAAIPAGSAKVLLVDDEELARTSVAAMLEDAGFTVTQAASGFEALRHMRSGPQPDVLVTDYAMPGMSGAELAREARQRWPDLPVLMITGYANLSDKDAAGLPRLAKPFRQPDIAGAIASLLAAQRAVRTPEAGQVSAA